jgi:hypothetical protein
METDYTKIHPLFEPIEKFFEFVIVGNAFMMMPDFQETFKSKIPAMQPMLDKYNKEVGRKIVGSKIHTNIQFYLIYAGRLMAIAIFDFLQSSKYGNYLSNTDIFKFSKHIRNGAAHNNKFTFDPKTKKELLAEPVKWGGKTIDVSLMGKTVFPDFINTFSLLFLMQDISKMIELKQTTK